MAEVPKNKKKKKKEKEDELKSTGLLPPGVNPPEQELPDNPDAVPDQPAEEPSKDQGTSKEKNQGGETVTTKPIDTGPEKIDTGIDRDADPIEPNRGNKAVAEEKDRETGTNVPVTVNPEVQEAQEKIEEQTGTPADIQETEKGFKVKADTDRLKDRRQEAKFKQETQERRRRENNITQPENQVQRDILKAATGDTSPDIKPESERTVTEDLIVSGVNVMQTAEKRGEGAGEDFNLPGVAEDAIRKTEDAADFLGIGTDKERDKFFGGLDQATDNLRVPSSGVERNIGVISGTADFVKNPSVDQAVEVAKTQSSFFQTDEEIQAREAVVSGVGANVQPLIGLGIGSAGAVPRATEQTIDETFGTETTKDQPNLQEGVTKGFNLVGGELQERPGEFIAEEAGEEAGEAIATAGVGALVPSITPDITPDQSITTSARNFGADARETVENIELPSLSETRKGQVTIPGSDTEPGPASRPGPVNTQPDIRSIEPQVFEPEIDTTPEPDTSLDNQGFDAALSGPTAETDVADNTPTSNVFASPRSQAENIPGIDARFRNEVVTDVDARPEVVAESSADVRIEDEPRIDPLVETQPTFSSRARSVLPEDDVDAAFGQSESDNNGESQDFQFTPTLGGSLFGETQEVTEEEFKQLQEQSFEGFGQRNPLEVEEDEENLF